LWLFIGYHADSGKDMDVSTNGSHHGNCEMRIKKDQQCLTLLIYSIFNFNTFQIKMVNLIVVLGLPRTISCVFLRADFL
jgi:hypothetical protein